MKRYCLALDLKDDPQLIREYEDYHKAAWPEVISSILDAGVIKLEIYRVSNRLFMIIEAAENFSLERKIQMDAANEKLQEWEVLMWKYQQALPVARSGEKWILMEKIFTVSSPPTSSSTQTYYPATAPPP